MKKVKVTEPSSPETDPSGDTFLGQHDNVRYVSHIVLCLPNGKFTVSTGIGKLGIPSPFQMPFG